MIDIYQLEKSFGTTKALDGVSLSIAEREVFGLVGTNGAGKSTLLRLLSGVLKPKAGTVTIDDQRVYDNPEIKKQVFFIAEDPYYFSSATPTEMERYYRAVYDTFDKERFYSLLQAFGLESNRRVATFSKGMKKQLAIVLAVASGTKYILCDETFDGLDPVMRQGVKSLFAKEMEDRGLTPIIASHNLRELEDICDHVGLLHQGGVLLSKDIADMKLNIQKVQCVFATPESEKKTLESLDVMVHEVRGRLHTITVRGAKDEVLNTLACADMVFSEVLALSLEEIFISETEVVGYDIKKFILG